MNIHQIISKEEMERISAFCSKGYGTYRVGHILYQLFAIGTLFWGMFLCVAYYATAQFVKAVLVTVLVVWLILTIRQSRLQASLKKSLRYLKNIDKKLGLPEQYEIILDDERLTVNGRMSIRLKDVAVFFLYEDYFILGSVKKTAAVIRLDSEQKKELYATLKSYKVRSACLDSTEENRALIKPSVDKARKKMKKELALLAVIFAVLLATLYADKKAEEKPQLPQQTVTDSTGSNPVADDSTQVEISTPQQLVEMAQDYEKNGHRYLERRYVLTADIDMAGVTGFLPIGRNRGEINGFCSEFDGQGHTIKNLYFDESFPADEYGSHYVSLFDTIAPQGVVKNVNVENIELNIDCDNTDYYSCAGFASKISGKVDNCHVQGRIYNPKGGGAGFVHTINGVSGTEITNCSADVEITGSWGMGGFFVNASQDVNDKAQFFRLYNCASYGSITAGRYPGMPDYYDVGEFGGFADKIYSGIFENCHVRTPVIMNNSAKYIGGFVANTEGDPITGRPAQYINCTYDPDTTNLYLIGMINWKGTKGDYGDAQFTPEVKHFSFG